MKKVRGWGVVCFVSAISIVWMAGSVLVAEGQVGEAVIIKKAKAAIKVDGKLDEWKEHSPILMNIPEEQCTDYTKELDDFSSVCYLAWDNNNLYFAADVKDDFVSCKDVATPDFQHSDYYRFYIDSEGNWGTGGNNMAADDYEFVFTPTGPEGKPMVRECSTAWVNK